MASFRFLRIISNNSGSFTGMHSKNGEKLQKSINASKVGHYPNFISISSVHLLVIMYIGVHSKRIGYIFNTSCVKE